MTEQDPLARLEVRLGRLLTIGSMISTVLLAIGVATWLVVPGAAITGTLISAGLLILMATPVARVAVSVVGFAVQREWRYVLMTAIVLATLAGSVAVAVWDR